ncbi:hypothetical protein HU200_012025 [Digitaria exilis]|uniref:Uncharacterized protein n=1 Tax=Digitaria exilis TaxID=1010633 RepID=A0A835KM71_9POAL|nr:hypothetical protein HU200_012025 [Digitaria exilis]
MAARAPYFAVEESARGIRKGESPAAALRRILATPGAHQGPAATTRSGAPRRARGLPHRLHGRWRLLPPPSSPPLSRVVLVVVKPSSWGYIRRWHPKACGHTEGRESHPREEAIMHIKAAVDARNESGSDIVIVARSDARQAISLDEALWRVKAFA